MARRLLPVRSQDAGDIYDVLVGDDPQGFWLTTRDREFTVSRIGIGDSMTTDCFPDDLEAGSVQLPFAGWVGWIGYEPEESAWLRVERYVSVEETTGRIWAHAPIDELDEWAGSVTAALKGRSGVRPQSAEILPSRRARARHSPREYRQMISCALDAIRAGDAYQLCLTTRFTVPGRVDPRDVHAQLSHGEARYAALIRDGERALVGASPEQFLHLAASGELTSSPIKGTRPRGADATADRALIDELAADAKERAENLMIVDLMRNDLSRVCATATVAVARLFDVETHTHVHQLVSQVTGLLATGVDRADVVAATFPAGSMTGAPKHRAIEILRELEGAPRGAYSGCYGWLGSDGTMDLAMTIRSVVIDGDEAYVGAGGGLTIDSRPDFEIGEVVVKARAPLAALGALVPAEWEL